jgi:hypothetical protein
MFAKMRALLIVTHIATVAHVTAGGSNVVAVHLRSVANLFVGE